jgi:Tfp pilus assembly pilus retraction ATPase PilT
MQTMDSALADLVRSGRITRELAQRRASVPAELERLLGGGATVLQAAGGNGYLQ